MLSQALTCGKGELLPLHLHSHAADMATTGCHCCPCVWQLPTVPSWVIMPLPTGLLQEANRSLLLPLLFFSLKYLAGNREADAAAVAATQVWEEEGKTSREAEVKA